MILRLGWGITDRLGLFFIMFRYLVSSVKPMILERLLLSAMTKSKYIKYAHDIYNTQKLAGRMDINLIELKNTSYYTITNKSTKKALYLDHESRNIEKEKVGLKGIDEEILGEIWMIVQIAPDRYPNQYQIVHTVSTYVLTAEKDYMDIKTGKWKTSQLYFFQRHSPKLYPNEFWIKETKDSNRYLTVQAGKVLMKETNSPDDKSVWELSLVHHNKAINRSCYIQYAYSNMVLDVPKASDKPGIAICQYPCNNRFNQRWNLIKSGEFYRIENMKTCMCLDIKGESKKPGAPIIQWKSTGQSNQLWKLEYQGKNIYLIRSAMDQNLLLSVKDNSLKECADIVTTNDDSDCFWRIVGHIPE